MTPDALSPSELCEWLAETLPGSFWIEASDPAAVLDRVTTATFGGGLYAVSGLLGARIAAVAAVTQDDRPVFVVSLREDDNVVASVFAVQLDEIPLAFATCSRMLAAAPGRTDA